MSGINRIRAVTKKLGSVADMEISSLFRSMLKAEKVEECELGGERLRSVFAVASTTAHSHGRPRNWPVNMDTRISEIRSGRTPRIQAQTSRNSSRSPILRSLRSIFSQSFWLQAHIHSL